VSTSISRTLLRRPERSGRRSRRVRAGTPGERAWTPYLFLAPGFALFALTMLWPVVKLFQMSLYHWSIVPGATSQYLGLGNYRRAFDDPVFWRALENSGFYMLITVPAQIVLGLGVAVLLAPKIRGRAVFRVLYYLPVITSWVVASLLFQYLFLTDGGLINWLLHDTLHLTHHDIGWLGSRWTAMFAIGVLGVWKGIGWSMVIFLAALQAVPDELYEAAAIDGAGPWRRFRHVTLPGIRSSLAFVSVLLVIGGFNVFISVLLVTNGGPAGETEVLLSYMYAQAFTLLDFGYGSALGFILTMVVFAIAVIQLRLFRGPREARA
jgi:multiple sugar transport system permease protein